MNQHEVLSNLIDYASSYVPSTDAGAEVHQKTLARAQHWLASLDEAVERDADRWKAVEIVLDCITAVERHQMDESQFFGAVAESFENAMRQSATHSE